MTKITLNKIVGDLLKTFFDNEEVRSKYYIADNRESAQRHLVRKFEQLIDWGNGNKEVLKNARFNEVEVAIISKIIAEMITSNEDNSIFIQIILNKRKNDEESFKRLRRTIMDIGDNTPGFSTPPIDSIPVLDELLGLSYTELRRMCYTNFELVLANMEKYPYTDQVSILQELGGYMETFFIQGTCISIENIAKRLLELEKNKENAEAIVKILTELGFEEK